MVNKPQACYNVGTGIEGLWVYKWKLFNLHFSGMALILVKIQNNRKTMAFRPTSTTFVTSVDKCQL